MSDNLLPPIEPRALPHEVAVARLEMAVVDERDEQLYAANVEAHLSARRTALQFLETEHQRIADGLDFDLAAATRPAAAWQMAGRCIGIARLTLDAVDLGYCGEVIHLARALHEANRLLHSFEDPEEEALLRKWLADEDANWVRPKEVRNTVERAETRVAERARAGGGPDLATTKELSLKIYDLHSQASHHRRRWVTDAVFAEERTMIRGATTVWMRRAVTANAMVGVVDESIFGVGNALSYFHEQGWFIEHVMPWSTEFDKLHKLNPLPG